MIYLKNNPHINIGDECMKSEIDIVKEIQCKILNFKAELNDIIPQEWEIESYSEAWFRGENAVYKETQTSITREIVSSASWEELHTDHHTYRMWLYEKTKLFLKDNHEDIYELFDSSLHYPYFMQHYGIPTDFLDFTPELETALYFAISNCEENSEAVLWLFAPTLFNYANVLNHLSFGTDDRDVKVATAYQIGAAENQNFYDAMVYGRNDDGSARIRSVKDFERYTFEINKGFSKAISPISEKHVASPLIDRMYKQSGFFLYSKPFEHGLHELTNGFVTSKLMNKLGRKNREADTVKNLLLRKITFTPEEVKILKGYLLSKGFDDQRFGFDDEGDKFKIDRSHFSFDTYIRETGGVKNAKSEEVFVKTHIKKIYTPLFSS